MSIYQVIANRLNLRQSPDISSDIITVLGKDTLVWGIKKSESKEWIKIQFCSRQHGWLFSRYLKLIEEDYPAWLPVACQEIGIKEYGENAPSDRSADPDNPRIVEYLKTTKLNIADRSNDETPWCSAFVNWCLEQADTQGTDDATARSWLHWGRALDQPKFGCIVVFKRPPNPQSGHVAFYVNETATHINVLGGNQGDEVNVSPYEKRRLIGYRWNF